MHENKSLVVSDSLRPHGLQPTRLLRPWEFPGKSTGVGCHCLLRRDLYYPLQESNLTITNAVFCLGKHPCSRSLLPVNPFILYSSSELFLFTRLRAAQFMNHWINPIKIFSIKKKSAFVKARHCGFCKIKLWLQLNHFFSRGSGIWPSSNQVGVMEGWAWGGTFLRTTFLDQQGWEPYFCIALSSQEGLAGATLSSGFVNSHFANSWESSHTGAVSFCFRLSTNHLQISISLHPPKYILYIFVLCICVILKAQRT